MGTGIYVHVPFCRSICPYCDFTVALSDPAQFGALASAILQEAELRAPNLVPSTLYFGGGTPTELPGELLSRLVRGLARAAVGLEVTVEANPESVTAEGMRRLREAGVTRVSLGVQSADPGLLRTLGRGHTLEGARDAYRAIREAGIPTVNVDLMFGLPGQDPSRWEASLDELLSWEPDHLSAYALELNPAVPMARALASGRLRALPDEAGEAQYSRLCARARAAGLEHYEVSNFARPGARSEHNQAYWSGRAYVGLGPGAHSFRESERAWNVRRYREYIRRIQSGESALEGREDLSAGQRLLERIFLGLRTASGVVFGELPSGDREAVAEAARAWAPRQNLEWVALGADRMSFTEAGFWYSQGLTADFIAGVETAAPPTSISTGGSFREN